MRKHLRLSMFGSEQVEAEGALGVLRADEAWEAAEEASQVAEEAFGQVGSFQAIAPGAQPQFQEGDGRFEALPELLDEGGLGARPAAEGGQGPAPGLPHAPRLAR